MRSRRLKVLVISGGGVFGMIPCHFLSIAGDSDPAKLDVIAGTSAGGILALCYASGRGTRETRKLFREAVPAIFKKSWLRRLLPGRSLYSSSGIESFLRQALPGKVRDCPRRFIVPSLNFRRKAPVIFHNFDGSYLDYELWKIGRSTSAAPIFFEPFSENILIDGGIIESASCIRCCSGIFMCRKGISTYSCWGPA